MAKFNTAKNDFSVALWTVGDHIAFVWMPGIADTLLHVLIFNA